MIPVLVLIVLLLQPPGSPGGTAAVHAYAELPGWRYPLEGKFMVGVLVYDRSSELIYENLSWRDFSNGEAEVPLPGWLPGNAEVVVAVWEPTKMVEVAGVPLPSEGEALMGTGQRNVDAARRYGVTVLLHGRFPHWDENEGLLRGWVPEHFWQTVVSRNSPTPLLKPVFRWVYNRSMLVTVAPSVLTPDGFLAPRDFWVIATPTFEWTTFIGENWTWISLLGRVKVHAYGNVTWVRVIRGDIEQNVTIRILDPGEFGVIKVNDSEGATYVVGSRSIPSFGVNLTSFPQLVDYEAREGALIPTGVSAGNSSVTISLLGAIDLLGAGFPAEGRGVTVVVSASFRPEVPVVRGNNSVELSTPFGNVTRDWLPVRAAGRTKAEIWGMAENGTWVLVDPLREPLRVEPVEGGVRLTLSDSVPDAEGTVLVLGDGWEGRIELEAGGGATVPLGDYALIQFLGDSFVYMPQTVRLSRDWEPEATWSYDILPPLLALAVLLALLRRFWGGALGLPR